LARSRASQSAGFSLSRYPLVTRGGDRAAGGVDRTDHTAAGLPLPGAVVAVIGDGPFGHFAPAKQDEGRSVGD
jgi:hypothetical protein